MRERERNVLFNDALNTFYLRLYGVRHMVKDHSDSENETCCHHIGYSYRLTARVLLYAPCHRQDTTYHSLCYTSHGALAGTRNSSMGPPHEGSIQWPIAPWVNALPLSYVPLPEIMRDNYFNGYSFLMLYPTDRTSVYSLCYTSCGTLVGMWNSSMGPPGRINPTSYHTWADALPLSYASIPK